MTLFKSIMLLLLVAGSFTACKKENDTVVAPVFKPEGRWSGKLSEGTAAPTGFFAMQLKPGGKLDRFSANGTISATGTWQLSGNSFTGNYRFVSGTKVTLTGTLNKEPGRIAGTWTNNGDESGTFHATQTE